MALITTEGLNHLMDVGLNAAAQTALWYVGLINNSPAPTLAAADTMASHAGWVETSAYTGNRKAWTEGASAAGVVTNSVALAFAMNATVTVYGTFGCAAATGTSAKLLWTAAFTGGTQAVNSGDTLNVTHTITAASA